MERRGSTSGGPCLRTNPGNRPEGQLYASSDFHPKGDFQDVLNLHRCEPIDGGESTCVDEGGWGVCPRCGTGDGESMRGCSCVLNEGCWSPQEPLQCWGGQFPGGGFCWPLEGPPAFQCEQEACGQAYGIDGGSYCEHYPEPGGQARCMPQWCEDLQAELCAGADVICTNGFDGTPDDPATDCDNECSVRIPEHLGSRTGGRPTAKFAAMIAARSRGRAVGQHHASTCSSRVATHGLINERG